jgi:hypothetical protein
MRLLISISLLIITLGKLTAQSDFRPGYIITHSLDTLHGLVDYRGEIRNMKVCTFKETHDDPAREYLPDDILGYRYNTGKFYVTKTINTKEFADTVFVEFLLKGLSNLYYYNSTNYSAYFIESENKELLELNKRKIEIEKDGKIYYKDDNRYLGVLTYAFADCPEVNKDIVHTGLTHKSLIQLTKRYHDYKCTEEACIVYEKKLPVLRIELEPLIGYAFTSLSFRDITMENVNFQMSTSPFAGLGLNLIVPRWNEKLSLRMNLSYNKDYFYGTKFETSIYAPNYNFYYHIHNSNFTGSLALNYTYPKGKIRPKVFLGFFGQSIVESTTKIYSERIFNNNVTNDEDSADLFGKYNKGLMGGMGMEYFLKKLKAFSNLRILHGSNAVGGDVASRSTSVRLSTGLTF